MQADVVWQRALLLFEQQRWELAIRELRSLLAIDADHAAGHALLAMALCNTDDLAGAEAEARTAVGLAPESPFTHRALAVVHLEQRRNDEAAAAVLEAIALDPESADLLGLLAQVRCNQRRWPEALAATEQGLALDPEDVDCLNLRSIALTKLGRAGDATDSVDAALAKDPDNPYTHQARGWALLHRGDPKGALHHFQEALRRDPSLDGARQGLVEALKARHWLYRVILGLFLWLDGKSAGHQFAILIGAWMVARFGSRALLDAGYHTAGVTVGLSWLVIVLVTSCAVPIFNLLLLLHPLGRHALDPKARIDALLLGATLATGIGVALYAWLGDSLWAPRGQLFWLVFLLPVAGLGLFHAGLCRRVLQVFCVGAVGFWIWWCWQIAEFGAQVEPSVLTSAAERKALLAGIKAHVALHTHLLTACAYSTWFVMLAPKGRPPRRSG